MNQTVYILILISLVVLFLFNKYEREKLQRLLQEQLLKIQLSKIASRKKSKRPTISTMSSMPSIKTIDWDSYLLKKSQKN